ncbi:MAG: GerMN domain-containing protein [Candidatus Pelethousia sp.]|nr:GerMN domain-containing protein [Candidatus Pelethousia sp.]
MGNRLWILALVCLLALSAVLAGCSKAKNEAEAAMYEEDQDAGYRRTVLYYATDDGYIVPVMKRIPWEEGIGKAALGYLVDNASNRTAADQMGLTAVVPEGVTFSLRIGEEGAAVLDLAGLTKLGDAEAEQAMVTGIVNTLTEFDSIQTVRITLDGAKAALLPHGTDISGAFAALPLNVEEGEVAVSSDNAHAITLYFPNASASLNVPVTRYAEAQATLSSVMQALLDGPKDASLAAFPEGTKLLSAYIADGVACVDLSGEFKEASETEGLCAALQTSITLTANELEPVYGTDIYVEGEAYALHSIQVNAPVYVNEFK